LNTLREKMLRLLKTIGSPVERSAFVELPARPIVASGAIAGILAALTLLAVAHLGDVFVLRHYHAFVIGYVYTVFSSVGLLVLNAIMGAVAAYVYLRAEEYLGSGKWLAVACFFPLFASTGTFVAERLTDAAGLGMSSLAPVLRVVLTLGVTLAMTWLFWFPWRSFFRLWLTLYAGRQRSALHDDDIQTPADTPHSDPLESSRSYMRVRREIALIRKHRSGELDANGLGQLKLPDDLLRQPSSPAGTRVHLESKRKVAPLRRVAWFAGAALAAGAVIAMLSSPVPVPDVLRRAVGQDGAPGSGHTVRIWVKAAGLNSELIEQLANEALSSSGSDTTVDAVDIDRFSILAVRTIMFDGMPDIVISTRQDLREMADQGMLKDLAPLIERDSVDLDAFVDSCVAELSLGDTVFGLPLSTSPLLLYINTRLMGYTGLSPDAPPVLWTDLLEYSKALTWFTDLNGTPVVSQLGFAPTDGLWHTWLQLASASLPSAPGSLQHAAGSLPSAIGSPPSATSSPPLAGSPASASGGAGHAGPAALITQNVPDGTAIPHEWKLLVDIASSLRATALPDDNAADHRNPFYERQHSPEALFASGRLAMVISDHRLHKALSMHYPDIEYAAADLPVPDWRTSGTSLSEGYGMGVLEPGSGQSKETTSHADASWQAVKAIATDPRIQSQIAEDSGLLPGLVSLFDVPTERRERARGLARGDEEIERKFGDAQLKAEPFAPAALPSSSLSRIYRMLDRLVQGNESVSYVLEQIEAAIASHARQ
jgi:ABC-type glycerol-3-phosphate transport system substrate-binding protein